MANDLKINNMAMELKSAFKHIHSKNKKKCIIVKIKKYL